MSVPHIPIRLAANRYELGEELDRGGMGTVFVAYDTYQNRRRVALKTISGTPESVHLELFQRELSVLGSLSHPNIVDVYDSGYLDEFGGTRKPFFVMPLLDGQTLDKRMRQMGERGHFTVDESIHIMDQVARGLTAAHGRGIIHRDLKPSNIFVLPDLSVKIIDFGVAQLVGANSKSGQKGTLLYMAPEQIAENQSSALSDQFSLGAVFYEILVGRRAFERDNEKKVIDAILREIPPIATELDRNIPMVISQIVHKMLAKKPDRRFAGMRDVIETLKKASRREPIEYFNPDNFDQSIQSARAAFQRKNYELASEILYTIEAEGYVDAEALQMRQEALAAIRSSRVARDLKHAHELVEDGNYTLASEKITAVLATEPGNVDALALEKEVRKKLEAQNIASLKKLARLHIGNRNFDRARESLERVLKLNETDSEALQTLNEVDRRDVEFRRLADKQQDLYQSARQAWQQGEVTSALGKIERVLSLDSDLQSPDPDQRTAYERFYQEVRARADSLRAARGEIQRCIDRRDFAKARQICDTVLSEDPNHAAFQALRVDIEDRQQRALLETIAEVDARLGREPRLDERLKVLEAAAAQFPGEPHFERHLQAARRKQDTVNRLVEKARLLDEQHRCDEAVSLWEIVEATYPAFPGLAFELTRVRERRDEKRREERRAELTAEVGRYLEFGDYDKADTCLRDCRLELAGDPALDALARQVTAARNNSEEAARLLKQARGARELKDLTGAAGALRRALQLAPRDREVRAEYLFTLTQLGREQAEPAQARVLVNEGLRVDPTHTGLRELAHQVDARLKDADVQRLIERAKEALSKGDFSEAMSAVDEGVRIAPGHEALEQMQQAINAEFTRQSDLETLHRIQMELETPAASVELVQTHLAVVQQIGARSGSDHRIAVLSDDLSHKLSGLMTRLEVASDPHITRLDLQPPINSTILEFTQAPPPPPVWDEGVTIKTAAIPRRGPGPRKWQLPLLAAAIVVLAIVGGIFVRSRARAVPKQGELLVEAAPDGAEISIDGVPAGTAPLKKMLPAGEHRIEARLAGYKDAGATLTVGAKSNRITLAMEPAGVPIHFVTDYRGLAVRLDGKPFADEAQKASAEGSFAMDEAEHVVEVSSGNITVRMGLDLHGGRVQLKGPPTTNQTRAVVLMTQGSKWSVLSDAEVFVDGASVTKNPNLPLAPGKHQLKIGSFEASFEAGASQEAWVFLSSGKLYGNLGVTTNVPDAEIYLDGEKNHLRTPAIIPSVQVRNVRLKIEKAGYAPYSAVVPLNANAITYVNATLAKLP